MFAPPHILASQQCRCCLRQLAPVARPIRADAPNPNTLFLEPPNPKIPAKTGSQEARLMLKPEGIPHAGGC